MKTEQSRMRVEGPLAPLASGFRNELAVQGYSPSWAVVQMRLLAGLSCWMAGKRLDADDIDIGVLAEFSWARRAARGATSRVPDPGGVLVRFLRLQGCFAEAAAPLQGPADHGDRFRRHLTNERGLQPGTIGNYEHAARLFLDAAGPEVRLDVLDARQVTRFVVEEADGEAPTQQRPWWSDCGAFSGSPTSRD